jgi:transcriptional regulator with XRE-family HTH domain
MAKKSSSPRRRELGHLGQRLRHWRNAKGWSQEKLAWAAGLDFSHVNEIENGKLNPGVLTVIALSRALEISPATLFLPVDAGHKLQRSPAVQKAVQADSLVQDIENVELLPIHCQLVLLYARHQCWNEAERWLTTLRAWFPEQWQPAYTAARYHCVKVQERLQPQALLQIAESGLPYPMDAETEHDLQAALAALERVITEPPVRALIAQEPDLFVLQRYCPEQWLGLLSS